MNPTQTTTPTAGIIRLPSTSLMVGTWDGVSKLLAEFPLTGFDTPFSISKQPAAYDDFIVAIRWPAGDIAARYKLYDNISGVLYYPVYTAEPIFPGAVFEIWSTEDSPVGANTSPQMDFTITHYGERANCICTIPTPVVTTLSSRAGTVAADSPNNPFDVELLFP